METGVVKGIKARAEASHQHPQLIEMTGA